MNNITLVTLGPAWGLPFQSSAPFSIKLEVWLRMAGIAFEGRVENDPRKGPKGKSPWIETDEGARADSELIIEWLGTTRGVDPDRGVDAAQRAVGLAWRRTFEEHFHQIWEYLTFFTPAGLDSAREWFEQLPALPRPLIRMMMLRGLRKQLHARGIGRHALADIEAMGIADVDAAAAWLGERAFWLGDTPTLTDASAFGFLSLVIWTPPVSAVHRRAREHAGLVRYCERMGQRFFGERMSGLRPFAARPAPSTLQAVS